MTVENATAPACARGPPKIARAIENRRLPRMTQLDYAPPQNAMKLSKTHSLVRNWQSSRVADPGAHNNSALPCTLTVGSPEALPARDRNSSHARRGIRRSCVRRPCSRFSLICCPVHPLITYITSRGANVYPEEWCRVRCISISLCRGVRSELREHVLEWIASYHFRETHYVRRHRACASVRRTIGAHRNSGCWSEPKNSVIFAVIRGMRRNPPLARRARRSFIAIDPQLDRAWQHAHGCAASHHRTSHQPSRQQRTAQQPFTTVLWATGESRRL